MNWQDVLDQSHVVEVLRRAIASERVPHAYLFHGPDGTGKRAAALAFAQTLECERGGDAPCNECNACSKVSRLIHPDVHVLFPYPNDVDESEVAVRLQLLAEDPYATIDFARRPSLDDASRGTNKQTIYPVGRVHEDLLRPMSFRPVEGRFKVAIVTDADAMNASAANAFLKLLEEPPAQTVFILTTSQPESLLPTIVSRCQRLRFDLLSASTIEKALIDRKGVDNSQASMIARMADGSYSRALDLLESEDLAASRDRVVDFLRRSYQMDVAGMSDFINWMSSLSRDNVRSVLGLMLRWVRDLVLYRASGPAAPLVNVDQAEAIERFCANLPHADLEAIAGIIEEAIRLVERNVKVDLILINMGHLFFHAMRGKHTGPLFAPLSEVA